MKTREDFVTNSSSASFIICFARVEDEEKAKTILEKYDIRLWNKVDVESEMSWSGDLGADWCSGYIYGGVVREILKNHPDDHYIILEEKIEADWDEETWEDIFYYDFYVNDAIDDITQNNGFNDIHIAEGEGRDG